MYRQYRCAGAHQNKQAYLLMKISLNLSDLYILLGYCLGKLAWMATYEWMGGNVLCKVCDASMLRLLLALLLRAGVSVCVDDVAVHVVQHGHRHCYRQIAQRAVGQ